MNEQGLIAEVLAQVLYKLASLSIKFGIDFNQVADIALLEHKKRE